jgi:small conductance mechanosensitive channel
MELQATVVNKYLEKITDFGFEYVPKLIGGILVLFIGLWITNLITKGVKKSLGNSKIDHLVPFNKHHQHHIKILVAITVMGMVGIEMTSFIIIIGAAFSNWLSSIWNPSKFCRRGHYFNIKTFKLEILLMLKAIQEPKEITIFSTMLNTPDKKLVIIPNGPLRTHLQLFY